MDWLIKIVEDIELHSVDGIRDCFTHGIDPNALFWGEPPLYELTSEYTRTSRRCFKKIYASLRLYSLV